MFRAHGSGRAKDVAGSSSGTMRVAEASRDTEVKHMWEAVRVDQYVLTI